MGVHTSNLQNGGFWLVYVKRMMEVEAQVEGLL